MGLKEFMNPDILANAVAELESDRSTIDDFLASLDSDLIKVLENSIPTRKQEIESVQRAAQAADLQSRREVSGLNTNEIDGLILECIDIMHGVDRHLGEWKHTSYRDACLRAAAGLLDSADAILQGLDTKRVPDTYAINYHGAFSVADAITRAAMLRRKVENPEHPLCSSCKMAHREEDLTPVKAAENATVYLCPTCDDNPQVARKFVRMRKRDDRW